MIRALADDIPKAAAAVGTAAFGLSLVHEIGYFRGIGLEWLLTYAFVDFVRATIHWLPIGAVFVLIGMAAELLNTRIERGLTEEQIIASSRRPRALRNFRRSGDLAPKVAVATGVVVWTLLSSPANSAPVFVCLIFVWYALSTFIVSHNSVSNLFSAHGIMLFVFAPMAALASAAHGMQEAYTEVYTTRGDTLSALTSDGRSVHVLRIIERGVLALDSGQVVLLPWGTVTNVFEYVNPDKEPATRLCSWFGVICLSEQP